MFNTSKATIFLARTLRRNLPMPDRSLRPRQRWRLPIALRITARSEACRPEVSWIVSGRSFLFELVGFSRPSRKPRAASPGLPGRDYDEPKNGSWECHRRPIALTSRDLKLVCAFTLRVRSERLLRSRADHRKTENDGLPHGTFAATAGFRMNRLIMRRELFDANSWLFHARTEVGPGFSLSPLLH